MSLGAFCFVRCWVLGVWVLLEMPSLCHRHGNILFTINQSSGTREAELFHSAHPAWVNDTVWGTKFQKWISSFQRDLCFSVKVVSNFRPSLFLFFFFWVILVYVSSFCLSRNAAQHTLSQSLTCSCQSAFIRKFLKFLTASGLQTCFITSLCMAAN